MRKISPARLDLGFVEDYKGYLDGFTIFREVDRMNVLQTTSKTRWMLTAILCVWVIADRASAVAPQDDAKPDEQLHPDTSGIDQTGTPVLAKENELPPDTKPTGGARAIPDYDGRPPDRASAAEVLVWIPRGLFFPVRVGLDYLIRKPLVLGLTALEEHRVVDKVKSVFTWADGKAGIIPTAFYEFGISPSVGFYAFYDEPYGSGSKQILRGGFWSDKQQLALENRISVFKDNGGSLYTKGLFSHRPDHPFYGIGPVSLESYRADFNMLKTELAIGLESIIQKLNRIHFVLSYRYTNHSDGDHPSVRDLFPIENQSIVPGWGDYHLIGATLRLELDSRSPYRDFTDGTGLRMDLVISYSIDPADRELRFLRWSGDLAGFLDISGYNHVLGLRLYTACIEPYGQRAVPFTELVQLGGIEYMPAFLDGRFRGASGTLLSLDYRYPIWAYLDGELFVGLGNTFGRHLEGFAWDRLFLNWGLGVRSNHSRDISFDVLLTFGSNRLDADSFEIDRVGFVIGMNQGF